MRINFLCTAHLSLVALALLTNFIPLQADQVDEFLQGEMTRQKIPGMSIAVVRNGQAVKVNGYGSANLELNVPATPQTVYQMASMTKQFTAAAIVLLAKDGRLQLEDKIAAYLPGIPEHWGSITIRHLLSMTAGIKDYNQSLGDSHEEFDEAALVRAITALPLDFPAGTKWAYSNSNYILLAMIVKRLSGNSYDEFLAERVFKPFGMNSTKRDKPADVVTNRAALYELKIDQIVNARFINPTLFNNGDGGLLTTVLDLARWDAALAPGKLFNTRTLERIWTPASSKGNVLKHYGFGWYLNQAGRHRIVLHGGGRPGTSTQISRFL
ncbi:MAG TPA: serine hydrolase domain-containing protein, partial [Verrucomicrobiae bacterium]|nr:serine hydrolase domain-containing protein [Verrucomicrobiae bacterium]